MGPHAKKRKTTNQVEEITFDPAARQQFLTGFRKRKQARVRHAQEVAEKRYREDRIAERKRVREERNAEYQRAFEEHQRQLKIIQREKNESEANDKDDSGNDEDNDDEDGEWEGFAEPLPVDYEAEYIDEDKYTTVTVEEMDPSREGFFKSGRQEDSDDGSDQEEGGQQGQQMSEADAGSKTLAKKSQNADKPKKKKKKFRYESKDERKLNEAKIRLSKAKRAKARRGEQ